MWYEDVYFKVQLKFCTSWFQFLADQLTKGSPMVVMLEVRIQKSYITEYLEVGTQKSPAWNAQTKTEFCSFCKQWLDFELRGLFKHLTVTEVELLQLF